MKILAIINECNPRLSSVPLEGYHIFKEIVKSNAVTLVTHERNKKALDKIFPNNTIIYIQDSYFSRVYYKFIRIFTMSKKANWPLHLALTYPVYAEFNRKVYRRFKDEVLKGKYDIVYCFSPILPRYPYKIIAACRQTPFVLGPVNGGIPFPRGFLKTAFQEFAFLNFLRHFCRLIPGYNYTYAHADKILAGSSYTMKMLENTFALKNNRIELFYDCGIDEDFLVCRKENKDSGYLKILFVGRLVPYKGADMLIESIARLNSDKVMLTIVGKGQEMDRLKRQAHLSGVADRINFTGWIEQGETKKHYDWADIFCFPSVREFGGAVVLEAMACGLPCITINYGGVGEFVTDETGFRIQPLSREYVISELKDKIEIFLKNRALMLQMSEAAIRRASGFTWNNKAERLTAIFNEVIVSKKI